MAELSLQNLLRVAHCSSYCDVPGMFVSNDQFHSGGGEPKWVGKEGVSL